MGIFSFIKEAGSRVFGINKIRGQEEDAESEKDQEEHQQINERAARKLEQNIRHLNLKIDRLKVSVDGEMAVVSGEAHDQATREKIILAVGNTEGISEVDDRMDVEDAEPEAVFHTVEPGDDLQKIANEHYGDSERYMEIFEANKPMLKEPGKIYPGQVLRIPQEEER